MKTLMRLVDWTLRAFFFAVLVYFAVIRGPESVELVQAKRGLFEFKVNGEGMIRSKSRYTVTAFAEGSMRRLTLKVGDEVTLGYILTEILVGQNYESLRAGTAGVISKILRGEGGKVERKEPVLEISDPTRMEVLVELQPSDAEQVHMGDAITISKWGGAEPLKGVVTQINKTQITGELREIPEDIFRKLGSRTQVEVGIQVAQFPDALKLPIGAAFKSKNDWTVYKVEDGRARKKRVTITNRNNEEVMIGAGVSDGETVINHPGDLVKDSVRVTSVVLK